MPAQVQHPSIGPKEIDLLHTIAAAVPVSEVIYAQQEAPPFALLRYVDGITFRELKRSRDWEAIAQAAASAGEVLAAIGRFRFDKAGWIGPGPKVTRPLLEGNHSVPRFVDLCLATPAAQGRVPAELRGRTHRAIWKAAPELALDRDPRLVHGDFNGRNLIVRSENGRWRVAAVIDWEFAVAASPLIDIANFLRYEEIDPVAEPHFSYAYRANGGELPDGWRRLSRLHDLAALCESLAREHLPEEFVPELIEQVAATVRGE